MHVCPECGKTMASVGGLEIHAEIAHRPALPVADQPAPSFVDVSLPEPRQRPCLRPCPRACRARADADVAGLRPTVPLTALLVLALLLVGVVALHRSSTASVPPAPHAAVVVSPGLRRARVSCRFVTYRYRLRKVSIWSARTGTVAFFRSGELHLVLLALLAGRPQHGYELMSELSARFGSAYRPSPGSIYPALNALEAEGLVAATDDGDRRVYRVTASGSCAPSRRGGRCWGAIEARTGTVLGGPSLESALARFTERVRAVAASVDRESVERLLDEAAARIEQGAKERP